MIKDIIKTGMITCMTVLALAGVIPHQITDASEYMEEENYNELYSPVKINETNFPDGVFRKYIDENFDKTDDDTLTGDEIAEITTIQVKGMGIAALIGIEHFPLLETLECENNLLTGIDVSKNTNLSDFKFGRNKIKEIDLSKNTRLYRLSCASNMLTELDLSNNKSIIFLNCSSNTLTHLDLSENERLTEVQCYNNKISRLDISKCTSLEKLNCMKNELITLDARNSKQLSFIKCEQNLLEDFKIAGCDKLIEIFCEKNQIKELDLTGCTKLYRLYCNQNKIENLIFSGNDNLLKVECQDNCLEELDIRNCKSILNLFCGRNKLKKIRVDGCSTLQRLACNQNELEEINLNGCVKLFDLSVGKNKLTTIDVSDCPMINSIGFSDNNIMHVDFSDKKLLKNLNADGNYRKITLVGGRFDMKSISEDFDMNRTRNWTNAEVDGSIITVSDPAKEVTYEYDVHRYDPYNTYSEIFTLIPVDNQPVVSDADIRVHPKPRRLYYNGTDQELVEKGIATKGVFMYSLYEDGEYSEKIPTAVDEGIYNVWYYVKTSDIYFSDSKKCCVEAVILPEAKGDINADRKINTLDLILLKRYLLCVDKRSLKNMTQADTSGDGRINVLDLFVLKKFIISSEYFYGLT
ncbi:MAG: hypothetical protein E7505_03745 [Ruminococcus sp.]|nr:hypothetical protein [Ruminococcus sp.]